MTKEFTAEVSKDSLTTLERDDEYHAAWVNESACSGEETRIIVAWGHRVRGQYDIVGSRDRHRKCAMDNIEAGTLQLERAPVVAFDRAIACDMG